MRSRYAVDMDSAVPEAWLYWPITAGGLGLLHPLVNVFGYKLAFKKSPYETYNSVSKPGPPRNWDPLLQRVLTAKELQYHSVEQLTPSGDRKWTSSEESLRREVYFLSGQWLASDSNDIAIAFRSQLTEVKPSDPEQTNN